MFHDVTLKSGSLVMPGQISLVGVFSTLKILNSWSISESPGSLLTNERLVLGSRDKILVTAQSPNSSFPLWAWTGDLGLGLGLVKKCWTVMDNRVIVQHIMFYFV